MTPEAIKCPCCGQGVEPTTRVGVDLTENILRYGLHAIHLPKRLADLAFVLVRRMPGTVDREYIKQQLWGDREPDWAETSLSVAISQLRFRVKPLGLEITNVHGIGWRMAEVSRTEIINPMERQYARA